MKTITDIPFWGTLVSLLAFYAGYMIQKKLKLSFLQPILVATILIVVFLKVSHTEYKAYEASSQFLVFMLPVTGIVLAYPLYRQIDVLKRHLVPILLGVTIGTITTIVAIIVLGKMFGLNRELLLSMIPKGATSPVAIELSSIIGGVPYLTIAFVVLTGLLGGSIGPEVLTLMRIKNKIARGIALGSMFHAVGTARAFKENELEGTMSGVALALTAIITAVIAPIAIYLLNV